MQIEHGSDAKTSERLIELDAVRGIAALCVVLYHYLHRYNTKFGHSVEFPHDFNWGWMGVQVFFVLSGFVIYMSLERAKTPWDFAWLRAIRLYPTYWAGIATTTAVICLAGGLEGWNLKPWHIICNFTMFHSFALLPSVDGAYWSLAEELKFYMLMIVFKWFGHVDRPFLICLCWLLVASAFGLLVAKFDHGMAGKVLKYGTIVAGTKHCVWFVFGISIYRIWKYRRDWQGYGALLLGVVYLLTMMSITHQIMAPAIIGGFAAIICFRPAFLRAKVLLFLGAISYPWYVLHQNIGYVLIQQFYALNLNPYLAVTLTIAVSIVLAWLVHRFIERPSGKYFRDRFKRRKYQAKVASA